VDIYLTDRNTKSFLHTKLDVLHDVVGYFADTDTVFEDHIEINDYQLVYNPDLDATAVAFTSQYLSQAIP